MDGSQLGGGDTRGAARPERRPRRPSSAGSDGGGPRADIAADPDADPYAVARTIVLDQLGVRARSRAELRTKLASRNVPDDVAEAVLDRMEAVHLVDDGAFAAEWVRQRHNGKGLAARALTAELRRKGVDDEAVRRALDQLDPGTERTTAKALVARRLAASRGLAREARVRRLAGMLARKGYPPGLAFQVVRDALASEGQDLDDLDGPD